MMKRKVRTLAFAACAVMVFASVRPSYALRGMQTAPKVSVENRESAIDSVKEYTVDSAYDLDIGKAASSDEEFRAQFEAVLKALKTPVDMYDDDVPADYEGDAEVSSHTWILQPYSKSIFYTGASASMTRVSLSISSSSDKRITVSATATANGVMDRMGLMRINVQRYFKGKWLTVFTTTNTYSYGVTRFIYSAARSNYSSGSYYRVTAQFASKWGSYENVVSKTSGSIRCR